MPSSRNPGIQLLGWSIEGTDQELPEPERVMAHRPEANIAAPMSRDSRHGPHAEDSEGDEGEARELPIGLYLYNRIDAVMTLLRY
jgi:hypothetical protein